MPEAAGGPSGGRRPPSGRAAATDMAARRYAWPMGSSGTRLGPAMRFRPAGLERRFRLHSERRFRGTRRLALGAGIVLYALFGALDRVLFPDDHATLWAIRYGLGLPPLLAAFVYLMRPGPRRHAEAVLAGAVLAAGLSIVAMIALVPPAREIYFAGLILVSMFGYTVFRLRFWPATAVSWLTVGCFEAVAALTDYGLRPLVAANFFYLAGNVVGMMACYALDWDARRNFLLLRSLRRERARVVRLARHDALTGLLGRRAFLEQLESEWARCARLGLPLSLLAVDVDHFKRLNDSLGHAAGDECLRRVARALEEATRRPGDAAGRLGGEEFALLLPGAAHADAHAIAESLRARIEAERIPHPDSPVGPCITVSVGVATAEPAGAPGPGCEALLRQADRALYAAKRGGRNRVVALPPPGLAHGRSA